MSAFATRIMMVDDSAAPLGQFIGLGKWDLLAELLRAFAFIVIINDAVVRIGKHYVAFA